MERITTNFRFGSTAAEVIEGVDLSGKRAIVTDGASASVSRQRRRSVLPVRQSRSQCGGLLRHALLRKTSGFRQATTPSRSDLWTFRIWLR
jgi:hypothetical protein